MEIFTSLFLKYNKYTSNIILEDFLDNINNYIYNILILHIYNFVSAIIFHKKNEYKTDTDYRINYFDYYILQNDKLSEEDKNYLFNIFSKTQKTYNSLNRISFLYKKYKAKHYDVNCDLCMNDFNTIKSNIIFSLFCKNDKTIYKFRISDIITIINNTLTYDYNFISTPQEIKNPYTNIPFDKGELYYIYFKIKNSSFLMPYLFDRLFTDNFDLFKFKMNNECYLREESIKKFIKSDNILDKRNYILSMFEEYFIYAKTTIDFFYPGNILVHHFNKPYLDLYLKSIYSLNPDLKFLSTNQLIQKLINFNKLNPNYGEPFVTKKRDNENNIYLIYRFNTSLNTNSNDLLENLQNTLIEQNNHRNGIEENNEETNEEHHEEYEDEEDEEEIEPNEIRDNDSHEREEEEINEEAEQSYDFNYLQPPLIYFNPYFIYGNTISD